MTNPAITTTTNDDDGFYDLLGPFLARREVAKKVGDRIWDDDSKTWFVACRVRRVLGFCAVTAAGKVWTLESLYTLDGYEHLAEPLVAAAVAWAGGHELRAVVLPPVVDAHRGAGFAEAGPKGSFVRLHRPAEPKEDS